MKIISFNVNGLRAAYKYGFFDWLKNEKPDIVCLQEIKLQKEQLPDQLLNPLGYYTYLSAAVKKGYSGTLVYSKTKSQSVSKTLGFKKFDQEGRILKLDFKNFTLINLYLPHGSRNKSKLPYKLECYQRLFKLLPRLKNKKIILTGDFNIAHLELDLARPKENKNNIMFTPKEREQINQLLKLGYIDSFRLFNKKKGQYSWWPYFRNARERNLGWRLDYIFVSKKLKSQLKKAFILPQVKMSDHCPVGIELEKLS